MTTTTRTPITGSINLVAGHVDGRDADNPRCGNCGESDDWGPLFGIVAEGVPGRICSDCAETHPTGQMLGVLVEALDEVDTAAYFAPAHLRLGAIGLAVNALGWLGERYAEGRGAAPGEAEVWTIVGDAA